MKTGTRFYREAGTVAVEGGYRVELDGRPVRTPARAPLLAPSRALGQALAEEWNAQQERLDPATMPLNRLANSAIDRVLPHSDTVVADIAAFAGADLVCHRAASPRALAERQATAWEPLLAWARARYGVSLCVGEGVMPIEQETGDLEAIRAVVAGYDAFMLAGLYHATNITGSVVLGLALAERRIVVKQAWDASRIDEAFQAEQWGEDAEAMARARILRADLEAAVRFMSLAQDE